MILLLDQTNMVTVWVLPEWASVPAPARPKPPRPANYGRPRSTPMERREWIRANVVGGSADVYAVIRRMKDAGLYAHSSYNGDCARGVRDALNAEGITPI